MICPRCQIETDTPHLSDDECLAALLADREKWRRRALTLEIQLENDCKRSKELTVERDGKK